jgi:DNA-binding protein WhiA
MAMTATIKDELARLPVTKPCCRKAEMSALLRFAGGLHLIGGRVVVAAEVDTGQIARRLRRDLAEVFGQIAHVSVLEPGGLRRSARYVVRVTRDGERLARQTGLIDAAGRPVRGLPRQIVAGPKCDAAAAWRGAFLAHGSLTEPGRSAALEITCPGPESALALAGAAHRLGVPAKSRDVRGTDRVVVRDTDAIGRMLTGLGAHDSLLAWEERRMRREVRAAANRMANFDDANLRRSARAAVAAGVRAQRALELLGDDVPDHLRSAGELRVKHSQVSLEELGAMADPPLTKDAIAGRIRRLLALADKRADALGVPRTGAAARAEDATA